MRKVSLSLSILSLVLVGLSPVIAQPPPGGPGGPPPGGKRGPGGPGGPGGMRGGGRRGLPVDQLGLSKDQKAKVEKIRANYAKKIGPIQHDDKLTREQKMAKLKPMRDAERKETMAVLTPAQRKKLTDTMAKMKAQWGKMGKGGPGGPGGPGGKMAPPPPKK